MKQRWSFRISRQFWLAIASAWIGINASGQDDPVTATTAVSPARADAAALAELFAEQHVIESGPVICQHAARQSPAARFEALRSWVIPDSAASRFRLTADFVAGGMESPSEGAAGDEPVPPAAHLVSPAYDLIRVAEELNELGSLRAIVTACPAGTPDEEVDRLALLALIAIHANEQASLEDVLDQWFKRIQPDPTLLRSSIPGLLLLAQATIDRANASPLIREMIRFATYAYRAEYTREAWLRHLVAFSARVDAMQASEAADKATSPESARTQWHLANLERAFEHGNAFPLPLYKLQRGSYRNLSNYGDTLLLFQSPLLGDYSVEATATGFGYREAHIVAGGRWTGPVYNHQQIMIGDPRGELVRQSITPPLGDTSKYGFFRTRVDVHDETASTWMNGRLIHEDSLRPLDSPWLGVRTNYRVQGGVDDLRITGQPTIPEQLGLVASGQLLGWYDYYQPPSNSNRLVDWQVVVQVEKDGTPNWQIRHPRLADSLPGSHVEQLLRYLRPMAEDGTIAFEFFYEPGQLAAYPVIGRNVYLLTDRGVMRHRLTDGRFDRTVLRPDNATPIGAENQQALPLLAKQWNRVEVVRRGDTLSLTLNGQTVCDEPLASHAGSSQFGIFHFADQTELRVRNLTWSGKWPRTLPDVKDQQLARPLDEILAWKAEQPSQTFRHAFHEDSLTSGAFVSVQGNPVETVQATPGGLIVRQTSTDNYRGATVAPVITVSGDFDVTVTFDQIDLQAAKQMVASVQFEVHANTKEQDLAGMQAVQNRNLERVVQCARHLTVDGNVRRSYFANEPAEGPSGRLKFCRRGDTIYYLAADNDSDRFRLVGQEKYPVADLQPHGIRLGVQAQGPAGVASVRFKDLTVRAERLSGTAISDRKQYMAELDRQRDRLPLGFSHDFAKQPPSANDFVSWSSSPSWDASDRGLEVISVGTDHWSSAGLSVNREFAGDFDIAFQFSPTDLSMPQKGQQTQVYLQLELADAGRTQVSTMLSKNDTGAVFSQMQVRSQVDGKYVYKSLGNQFIENANRMRLVRRGTEVVGIAGSDTNDSGIVVGSAELPDAPIGRQGVRMLLHTGGAGRIAKMMLQSIEVRAAQTIGPANAVSAMTPATPAPARRTVPSPPPQPKSLPSRVFDSIRGLFN